MTGKHFRSRRSYRPVFRAGAVIAVLAIVLLFILPFTLFSAVMVLVGASAALVLATALMTARRERIDYELKEDRLLLRRGGVHEQVALSEVQDANLIDFASARDFVKEQMESMPEPGAVDLGEVQRLLTRFCGISLTGLAAMGSGIYRTDIRNFRRTLVLLRIRNGGAIILSPKYSETMVSSIEKALDRFREKED